MKRIIPFLILLFISTAFQMPTTSEKSMGITLSNEEQKLYDLIMKYRKSKGLPSIPLSSSLTHVAQTHSNDLALYHGSFGSSCNLHSWSSQGEWSSCCYTEDHKEAKCMWDKPRELTDYTGDGFEIATYSYNPGQKNYTISAEAALDSWKSSSAHNDVILNQDIWKKMTWNAIGVGMVKGYATVWFGMVKE